MMWNIVSHIPHTHTFPPHTFSHILHIVPKNKTIFIHDKISIVLFLWWFCCVAKTKGYLYFQANNNNKDASWERNIIYLKDKTKPSKKGTGSDQTYGVYFFQWIFRPHFFGVHKKYRIQSALLTTHFCPVPTENTFSPLKQAWLYVCGEKCT